MMITNGGCRKENAMAICLTLDEEGDIMKERPILFTGEMVKAILDDRKTMTRRVIKPQPVEVVHEDEGSHIEWSCREWPDLQVDSIDELADYGKYRVGDRLWVKESWRVGAWAENDGEICVDYRVDGYCRKEWLPVDNDEMFERLCEQSTEDAAKVYGQQEEYSWEPGESPCRWHSSRFMPRWASRINLPVKNIRVERLQDITGRDVLAEGVDNGKSNPTMGIRWENMQRMAFQELWNKINAKWKRVYNRMTKTYEFYCYPWSEGDTPPIPKSTKHPERYHSFPNPWVWVVEFEMLKG